MIITLSGTLTIPIFALYVNILRGRLQFGAGTSANHLCNFLLTVLDKPCLTE